MKTSLTTKNIPGHTIICNSADCNNKGLCIGTKANYVCLCNLGYAGRQCQKGISIFL